ncbi:MAG TPA: carboxypeptidase-like regulatory domain-containing protein [Bacteroidales bacterium]|nr:carboxypeptidase-like regulatory domain-containing protein [Bacteroidales bacterium]
MRIIVLIGILLINTVWAATIQGFVYDKDNKEPLIGATVSIEQLKEYTVTGLDGSFIFKNIEAGTYYISISYLGYKSITQKAIIENNNIPIKFNFLLETEHTMLQSVTIVAHGAQNTDANARLSEKTSMQVINVVSASSIQQSPDLNIANVVQRISGVTLEKNSSGEAQYAILRGMDKRYNYTLVNGLKISSPHNKHRFVPLNIFPSDLADRVEVYKTLTADMEGDGSGGVINLVMKDSPNAFFVNTNLGIGYNSYFIQNGLSTYPRSHISMLSPREQNGKTYTASLTDLNRDLGKISETNPLPNSNIGVALGNRFLQKKLGIMVAANYSNLSKGNQSVIFSESYRQQTNTPVITSMREREYSERAIQNAVHIKTDYMINANHSFDWYNAYISMNSFQIRQTTTNNFSYNYDPENNKYDLNYQTRLQSNYQNILVSSLHGKHTVMPHLEILWASQYSVANNQTPERTHFNLDRIQIDSIANVYPDADGSTIEWAHNTDTDLSGFIHAKYKYTYNTLQFEYKVGSMIRNKERTNFLVEYKIRPDGIQVQGKDFNTIDQISWKLANPLQGSVGPLNYDSQELIMGYYGMVTINHRLGSLQTGIRSEHTNQGYFQYYPAMGQDSSGAQIYTDILPSIQCKYTPTNNTNIRVSYFKSINRPGFYEIVPYVIMEEDYTEFGNKKLKRARIHNIDVRYEYFPKKTEQLLVGVFYKQIQDPIEIMYTTVNRRQYGFGPGNVDKAQNIGFETDIIKYFRVFGVKANYTYTLSKITTPKTLYQKNEKGATERITKNQTRPLVGQSPHTANIALLYKHDSGIDCQLAASYTHDRLIVVSDFYNSDYWMSKTFQLDAAFEKKWKTGWSCFLKVNNLVNTPMYYYIKIIDNENIDLPLQTTLSDKTLVRKDIYSRSFICGIRKNFITN